MLANIENLRQDLNTQMNEHHDRLIHRFPPEISAEIFQMCLPTDIMDKDLHSETSKHVLAAPLVLSAVCRRWRAISQSTPQLWMDIPLRLRASNLRSLPLLAKDWIDRSGQLPLSINFTVSPTKSLAPALISSMIAVLNQYSTRWLQLKYEGPSSALSQFASHTCGYSMLKTLKLKAYISRNFGAFNLGTFKLRPTDLLELSFVRLQTVTIDWNYLARLNFTALSSADCLEALRRAPNLTHCTFSQILVLSPRSVLPALPSPIIHDSIQHLEFGGRVYKEIIEELRCASLRTCKIQAHGEEIEAITLASFFHLSGCSLESLSLLDVALYSADIDPLFSSVPALQHLYISLSFRSSDAFPREFFRQLSEVSTNAGINSPVYLPSLRSISFYPTKLLDWTLLLDLLVSPSTTNHLRKDLNCIVIAVWLNKQEPQPSQVAINQDVLRALLNIRDAGLQLDLQVGTAHQDLIQLSIDHHKTTFAILS